MDASWLFLNANSLPGVPFPLTAYRLLLTAYTSIPNAVMTSPTVWNDPVTSTVPAPS